MLNRIDLDSLSSLAPLPVPANKSAVLEGLENRDFVSDSSVFQFDRATGETQTFIAMDGAVQAPEIALSTDRGTLFATELLAGGDGFLLSYDVTGAEPVLLKSIPGEFLHLTPSPDGKYLYYTLRESIGGEQPLQAPLPDLVPAVPFAQTGYPGYKMSLTVGPDGTIYRAGALLGPSFATYSLYDPVSLQETFNIDLNHFDLDPPVASSPPRLFSTPVENIS